MEETTAHTLQATGISKSFPGVQALSNVDFSVRGGEVHALMGENGAGKSTLIKILMGVYHMDSGQLTIDGQPVNIQSPVDARSLGLQAVYQDVVVAPELSVGENFFTGRLPVTRLGFVDWARVYAESEQILNRLDIRVNPKTAIADLSPSEQTMVTIAKIVGEEARFVIFDEPTARLTNQETERLFNLIHKLKTDGLGIIYISHRMEEIFEICDKVTVLRDGYLVGTLPVGEVNEDRLVSMMVGRKLEEIFNLENHHPGEIMLEIENLTREPHFRQVSFFLRRGEVLGLFGLVGSGRTELLRTIFGAEHANSGTIRVFGNAVNMRAPYKAMAHGIGLVPEERKKQGLAMPLSVSTNINIASYEGISTGGIIQARKESARSQQMVENMNIRTPDIDQTVANLSGGNQQKVAIAKWLCRDADILLMDEPTTGVDVGAKVEIYRLIESLIQRGKAVLVCSSYLPEVIGLADRILVMAEGEITGEVKRDDANEELLLRMASKLTTSR